MIISIQYTLEITGRDRMIDDEIKWLFLKESTTAPLFFGLLTRSARLTCQP
jgi:hypothetical protein